LNTARQEGDRWTKLADTRNLFDTPRVAGKLPKSYPSIMSTLEQLEDAVRGLSPADRAAFRAWFAEFDAAEWDRQLEADVAAGRLDWLVAEARQDRDAGRCTDR
jgi:hypothetical protein